MSGIVWIVGGITALAVVALILRVAKRGSRRSTTKALQDARELFHLRREWLEAEFLSIASRSGKPRGLAWSDCEFQDEVAFARERNSGKLRALVGVLVPPVKPLPPELASYRWQLLREGPPTQVLGRFRLYLFVVQFLARRLGLLEAPRLHA